MPDSTDPTALDLLKRAEALLSALHGSVARHDNLAANLGCAGCELRDQISAALPSLAAAPAVLPPAADRAAVLREAADAAEGVALRLHREHHVERSNGAYDVMSVLAALAREIAAEERDEQQAQQGAHSCGNCEGVDPDTCWMNPNRPPEQCPAAEFEDYGQQCQKPVGHELHTFEERQSTTPPAVVAEPGKEN